MEGWPRSPRLSREAALAYPSLPDYEKQQNRVSLGHPHHPPLHVASRCWLCSKGRAMGSSQGPGQEAELTQEPSLSPLLCQVGHSIHGSPQPQSVLRPPQLSHTAPHLDGAHTCVQSFPLRVSGTLNGCTLLLQHSPGSPTVQPPPNFLCSSSLGPCWPLFWEGFHPALLKASLYV